MELLNIVDFTSSRHEKARDPPRVDTPSSSTAGKTGTDNTELSTRAKKHPRWRRAKKNLVYSIRPWMSPGSKTKYSLRKRPKNLMTLEARPAFHQSATSPKSPGACTPPATPNPSSLRLGGIPRHARILFSRGISDCCKWRDWVSACRQRIAVRYEDGNR